METATAEIARLTLFLYTVMMTSTHILRAATLSALLVPTLTLAYTTPEEVLNSDQNIQYYTPPPAARDAEAVQARQQADAAARRKAEQDALFIRQSSSSSMSSEEQTSSISDQNAFLEQLILKLAQGQGQQSSFGTTDQRILDRVKQQQFNTEVQMQAAQILASQQSLHGGAPLANSGPGTYIAALILAGAGLWTIWQARRMEKKA